MERINFVSEQVGNTDLPGVRAIVDRVAARSDAKTPEGLVAGCLDLMGPLEATEKTPGIPGIPRQGGGASEP